MADLTGKDTPATDPKSPVGKTGPVKPPVLEGTARPGAVGKPADSAPSGKAPSKPAEKPADKPAPASPAMSAAKARTDESQSDGGGSAWLAGMVGGIIGLGAAYGLAWFGLWPTPPAAPAQADPRLAQFATAIPELETVTGTVQDELSTLTGRVGALETSLAEAPAGAPAAANPALAEQLDALSARLDELAAAPGSDGTDAEALAALEADLASLRTTAEGTADQLAQTQQQLAALTQSADENAGADAAAIRLPLIFSGIESAFGTGRAFETELAALRQALPNTTIPEAIAGRAASGLARPETIASRLNAALPDMLAGRPADSDAGWQGATADWFRGLIAMRPAGAVDGDGPDAIIARLEDAVARRDFIAAEAELTALPEPMRRAAGTLADDIASLAAAQTFLADLRANALNLENGA